MNETTLLEKFYYHESRYVSFMEENGHVIEEWKYKVATGRWRSVWLCYKELLLRWDELRKRVEAAEWNLHYDILKNKKNPTL